MFTRMRSVFRRRKADCKQTKEIQKGAGLTSPNNEGRRNSSWRIWRKSRAVDGAGRLTSTPAAVQRKEELKREELRLIREIELITEERDELRDRLIYAREGAMNGRPYYRPNAFYESIKLKEKKVMSLLHDFETETTEARKKYQELKMQVNFYSNLHSELLSENNLLKEKLGTLKEEVKGAEADRVLQQHMVDLIDKDKQEKTSNVQTQQDQASASLRQLEPDTSEDEDGGLPTHEIPSQEAPCSSPS